MEFDKAIQFAQAVWPIARIVAATALTYGWLSPVLPHRGDSYVVERSTKLKGQIDNAKALGHKPKLSDKINLTILNVTRGAFIHRNIFHARVNAEVEKLRSEKRNQ